jgi:hypothetical protein
VATRRPTVLLIGMILTVVAQGAGAQLVPGGAEIQVNATSPGAQSSPSAAVDTSGRRAVVWQGPGDDTDIWLDLSDVDGSPLVTELRVSSQTSGCQKSPAVAFAPDGSFVVVWESEGQDGGGSGVYSRRFDRDGSFSGPEVRVNETTAGDQQRPSVAFGSSGSYVVAWESAGQDGDGWGVYARQLGASGPVTGEVQVSASPAGDQRRPNVVIQPTGHVVVAWEGPDGSGPGIFLRRFATGLTGPGAEVRANAATAGFQSAPSLAVDGSGNVIVAWEASGRDGGASGIVARRFDRFLSPLSGEIDVNATTAGLQSRPRVASAASGDFLIAWESWNQDAGGAGVFARLFNFLEQPAAVEFRVNTFSPGSQLRPALAASPAGRLLAAWESAGQDGDASGIFAQAYTLPGLDFYTVQPCRLFDTRSNSGAPLPSGAERLFVIAGNCGIPVTARAISVNVTAIDATGGGNIALFPGDAQATGSSAINFAAGVTRANNAILALAHNGAGTLTARATVNASPGQVHLILDVNGYFQ